MAKFISTIELETDFTTNDPEPPRKATRARLPSGRGSIPDWDDISRSPKKATPKSPRDVSRHTFTGTGIQSPSGDEGIGRQRRKTFRYMVTEQLIGQRIRPRNVIMNLYIQSVIKTKTVISLMLSHSLFWLNLHRQLMIFKENQSREWHKKYPLTYEEIKTNKKEVTRQNIILEICNSHSDFYEDLIHVKKGTLGLNL